MQLFPRSLNRLPVVAGAGAALALGAVVFVFWYYFSPKNLQVGYAPEQPVLYSHRLHAGELGMDCRYCHANVERSAEAMIPPTQTCMGCHALVKKDSALLEKVRESWEKDIPIEWVRVHKVPDHAYFNHAAHVQAGVGCVSCHGRIDQMEVVELSVPLSMGWCLDCHRNPEPHLRPPSEVTNMSWTPSNKTNSTAAAPVAPEGHPSVDQAQLAVVPPQHCSGCHR